MIDRVMVGVKVPDLGIADSVDGRLTRGVAEGVAEAVAVGLGLRVGFGVAVGLGVADGVDSKAGPSAAWTIKVRVKVRRMPPASLQEMVIL